MQLEYSNLDLSSEEERIICLREFHEDGECLTQSGFGKGAKFLLCFSFLQKCVYMFLSLIAYFYPQLSSKIGSCLNA